MTRGWVPERPQKTGGFKAAKQWLAARLAPTEQQTKPNPAIVAQAVSQHVPVTSVDDATNTMQRLVDDLLGLGPLDHQRAARSEEHTSELQSRFDIVCRLLLEK